MIIATDASSPTGNEASRILNICNACRYCEGLCATFQAMTLKRTFAEQDIDYLANLCHNCTACFHDCQYSPPHEFDVNVPVVLAQARAESYEKYAWPASMGGLFQRNGLVVSVVTALLLSLTMGLALALISNDLFATHAGPGAFYQVVGHGLMVVVAGGTFGFSVLAILVSVVKFWRALGGGVPPLSAVWQALRNAATLKHLDGGHGEGCSSIDDGFSNARRYYHQFTMWGFILCFAATCVATVYDYGLGLAAPYPVASLPVVLGTVGGVGLLIGPAGLFWNKLQSDSRAVRAEGLGMDYAFIVSLFLVSFTGLALLVFRDTAAMGVLLVVHLGFVLSFFVLLPYSKFVHGVYRFAALVRFAATQP